MNVLGESGSRGCPIINRSRLRWGSYIAFICMASVSGSAFAVDCSRVDGSHAEQIEVRICANPELEWLDRVVAWKYQQASAFNETFLRQMKQTDAEIGQQKRKVDQIKKVHDAWLQQRDACSQDACLIDLYYTRLRELRELTETNTAREGQSMSKRKVVEGKGWAVCEAYVNFLNALPQTRSFPMCELRKSEVQGMTPVQAEELDIYENLRLLYDVEQRFKGNKKWPPPEDFDAWRANLEWRVRGGFKPRIQKIEVVIARGLSLEKQQQLRHAEKLNAKDWIQRIRDSDATDAPLDSFLSYEEDPSHCDMQFKAESTGFVGGNLAPFDPATNKLVQMDLPTVFYVPMNIVSYGGSPYVIAFYTGSDASPGRQPTFGDHIRISRLQRYYANERRKGPIRYSSDELCHIF